MKALAAANHIDADRYEHPFTPTAGQYRQGAGAVRHRQRLASPRIEQLKGRLPPGQLVARMAQAGYKPEDVDVVVLTHGHPDHIGGLTKGGQPVFPNARYVFGAAEFDFWNKGENVREARKFNRELYVKIVVPLANRATFIKPGDAGGAGHHRGRRLRAFAGADGVHIESEGKRLLNWADTCNHYVVAVQRPDIQLDVDDDKEKAVATRKRILDMVATDKLFGRRLPHAVSGLGMCGEAPAAPIAGCRIAIS